MSGRKYLQEVIHRHLRSRVCTMDINAIKRTESPLFQAKLAKWHPDYLSFNAVHLERAPSDDEVPTDEEVALQYFKCIFISPTYAWRRYTLKLRISDVLDARFEKGEKIGPLEVVDRPTPLSVIIRPYQGRLMHLKLTPYRVTGQPHPAGYGLLLTAASETDTILGGWHYYFMKKVLQSAAYRMLLESGVKGSGIDLWAGYNPWSIQKASIPAQKKV